MDRTTRVQIPAGPPLQSPSTPLEKWGRFRPEVTDAILEVLMAHGNRLRSRTLERYSTELTRLAEVGDLDNVDLTEKVISGFEDSDLDVSASRIGYTGRSMG